MDISVQYGPNQREYDLVAIQGDDIMKVSVKGSQDGAWGLAQGLLSDGDYKAAIAKWHSALTRKTVFCFVQFQKTSVTEMPRIYLATRDEVKKKLDSSVNGRGSVVLYEDKTWTKKSAGAGTRDAIPDSWKISKERIQNIFQII